MDEWSDCFCSVVKRAAEKNIQVKGSREREGQLHGGIRPVMRQ